MSDERPHGLIFQWLAREGRGWNLLVGILATTMALAGFALLFQVVYPAARRQPLAVQRMVLLDSSSPAARAILDRVRDHDFLVLPPVNLVSTPPEAATPVFSPSFKDFKLEPKDILESRTHGSAQLPRLFRPEKPLLPPLPPAPVTQARPVAPPQSLQMTVTEGLEMRGITRPVTFHDARFAEMLNVSYRIAVAPDGRVALVVPLSDPGNQTEVFGEVRSAFSSLRFQTRPSSEMEWGTVTLQWHPEASAP
jgi:hypothetical protein